MVHTWDDAVVLPQWFSPWWLYCCWHLVMWQLGSLRKEGKDLSGGFQEGFSPSLSRRSALTAAATPPLAS